MTRVEYDPNDPTGLNPHAGGEKFLSDQMMAEARVGRPKAKLPVKCPTPKTLDQLQHAKFPELKILVPGLLVEGCALLAGRPKIGKSWLALDIAIAVARGGTCLSGRQCKQGEVLYLALEDGERRLQKRATKLLGAFNGEWPKALSYVTQWPRMNEGGLDGIDDWIKTHPDARLVIIDVLARFRAPTSPKRPAYEQDYEAIAKLQELATKHNVSIVIVHHTRKASSDDPVDEISGTLGVSGAADSFLVIKHTSKGKLLIGRGRDIEEVELATRFDSATCRWEILGAPEQAFASETRTKIVKAMRRLGRPANVKGISLKSGLTVEIVKQQLFRMADTGFVEKPGRGMFELTRAYKNGDASAGDDDAEPF